MRVGIALYGRPMYPGALRSACACLRHVWEALGFNSFLLLAPGLLVLLLSATRFLVMSFNIKCVPRMRFGRDLTAVLSFGQGFGQAFDGLFQQALGFNSQAQQVFGSAHAAFLCADRAARPLRLMYKPRQAGTTQTRRTRGALAPRARRRSARARAATRRQPTSMATSRPCVLCDQTVLMRQTYWGDMQGQQQQQQQPAQPAPAPQPHVAAPVLTRARARHVAAAPAPAPVVPDHKAAQAQARARQQAQLEAQQKARKAEAKPIPPPSSPMKGRSPAKVGTRGAASMYSEPIVVRGRPPTVFADRTD